MKNLIRKILSEQLNPIKWVKPDFESESEEFELFLSEIVNLPDYINVYSTPQKSWDEIMSNIRKVYRFSTIEVLTDEEWSQMENTDSWELETEEDIYYTIGGYGRDKERILKHSLEPIRNGGVVETPIVVYSEGNPPYLVAGNTRLSACKVLGVTPMVTKVYLNKNINESDFSFVDEIGDYSLNMDLYMKVTKAIDEQVSGPYAPQNYRDSAIYDNLTILLDNFNIDIDDMSGLFQYPPTDMNGNLLTQDDFESMWEDMVENGMAYEDDDDLMESNFGFIDDIDFNKPKLYIGMEFQHEDYLDRPWNYIVDDFDDEFVYVSWNDHTNQRYSREQFERNIDSGIFINMEKLNENINFDFVDGIQVDNWDRKMVMDVSNLRNHQVKGILDHMENIGYWVDVSERHVREICFLYFEYNKSYTFPYSVTYDICADQPSDPTWDGEYQEITFDEWKLMVDFD